MNLLHKLVAIVLFAACTTGLSADGFCGCGCCSEQNSQPLPFTLTEFIKAEKAAQAVMLSDLLQNGEFSNDEIARLLEVDVKDVARAREFFGPLEVDALVDNVICEYEKQCHKQFVKGVLKPIMFGSLLIAAEIGFFLAGWRFFKLLEENEQLRRQLSAQNK